LLSIYFSTAKSGQCDKGWILINNNCYQINLVAKTWENARNSCTYKNAFLVKIDNKSTKQALSRLLNLYLSGKPSVHQVFVGMKLVGEYRWLTGQPIAKYAWHKGLPDKFSTKTCAALMLRSGLWRLTHVNCVTQIDYICETENRKSF
jgi:hypothetical protein